MKDYLFLFRNSADNLAKLSETDKKEWLDKWNVWFKKLTDEGRYENVGDRLTSAEARTIKSTDKIVTDGPYTESKEIIGGFVKVKAENLDDATEVAKGCPIFLVNGSLEIRTSFYS